MLLMKEKALNGRDEKKRMTHRLTADGIGGHVERCLLSWMSWWGWCGGVHKIRTQIAQSQIGWATHRPVIRRLKLSVLLSDVTRFAPQPLKNFMRYVSSYRRKDAVAPAVLVQGFGTPLRDSIPVKENKSQFRLKTSRQKVHATFATVQL